MARVWIAEHVALARRVAIKVISEEALMTPITRQLFEREAQATARVESPHVVRVLDFDFTDEGFPFLVLELLVGETLEERIQRLGPLTVRQTATLVDHIGHAASAAHACGIVHRDIKAENIFLVCTRDGSLDARLLDFGVATSKTSAPLVHGTVGTIQYMSPEQLVAGEVDERSDIFALAICVYYALTARLPFDAETPLEMARSLTHRCKSVLELRPALPLALDAWFARALARDPEERFQSTNAACGAFAESLDRRTPMNVEIDVTDDAVLPAGVPRPGRVRWWLAASALLALVAFGTMRLDRLSSGLRMASAFAGTTAMIDEPPLTIERSADALVTPPRAMTSGQAPREVATSVPTVTRRPRIAAVVSAPPPPTPFVDTAGFGDRE
jgi:eukaryotic-like serine/threonine-protein kinase